MGSTLRYEVVYEECYEPYVIGSRRLLPRYDERFRGYGMNKIQHLYACHAAGLRFVGPWTQHVCATQCAE